MPAASWIDVHVDAGRRRDTWWGAFVARRHRRDGPTELLAERRGRIEGELPGPTPAEGIAAIAALRWLLEAEAAGAIRSEEPIVILEDNQAVASKLASGNTRGQFRDVWKELARLARPWRTTARLRVRAARSWENQADPLAVPHPDAVTWGVAPASNRPVEAPRWEHR